MNGEPRGTRPRTRSVTPLRKTPAECYAIWRLLATPPLGRERPRMAPPPSPRLWRQRDRLFLRLTRVLLILKACLILSEVGNPDLLLKSSVWKYFLSQAPNGSSAIRKLDPLQAGRMGTIGRRLGDLPGRRHTPPKRPSRKSAGLVPGSRLGDCNAPSRVKPTKNALLADLNSPQGARPATNVNRSL